MLILQLKNSLTQTETPYPFKSLWSTFKVFITNCGNNSGHTGQTHSRFPKCLWMCDTE